MGTEKRLIDANALESYLWVLFNFFGSLPCSEADKATQRGIKRCIGEVKKMPTVDAVEVVHGRWEDESDEYEKGMDLRCLVCGGRADSFVGGTEDWYCLWKPNFCPHCGARMDGDEDDNDT